MIKKEMLKLSELDQLKHLIEESLKNHKNSIFNIGKVVGIARVT